MATEEALKNITKLASADLSASQYCFMAINASGLLAAAGAGLAADGVLQDKPDAANRAGILGISGVSKIKCGAAVTAGDDLTPGTGGKAVTAGTGDVVAAKALEDGAGDGSIISALLILSHEPLV